MGLKNKKNLVIFIGIFVVLTMLVGFRETVFADLIKTVSPQVGVGAGDTVTIRLEVPGQISKLRRPADIMLVMDRSGSMVSSWPPFTNKLTAARNALKAFIDQTEEDGVNPGDYVGLATYSTDATLDFGIANMTAANKTAIKTAIDSFSAAGWTSIGDGMDVANQELINNGRLPEIAKYMVLATDGRQNKAASPYENNILQTAIDNNITIFTVGIGFDVTVLSSGWSDCVGCPDPNGDGFFSGEEIMKDIACKTDQNRLDPADNCELVWDTGNDPSFNDWDSPSHYFLANSSNLEDIYVQLADEISVVVTLTVIDKINTDIAERIVDKNGDGVLRIGDDISIWSCGVIPVDVTSSNVRIISILGNTFITIVVEEIGGEQRICIEFDVKIRDDASPGTHPINSNELIETCGTTFARRAVYFVIDDKCFFEEFVNPNIEIVNPAKPWLKTTGGDVGSFFDIDMLRDIFTDESLYNADYLVITKTPPLIVNFDSKKGWEINDYGGLTLDPDPGPALDMYGVLWDKYTSRCVPTSVDVNAPGNVTFAPDCNLVLHNGGDLTIDDSAWNNLGLGGGYTGDPAVVFVDGDLWIRRNIEIDGDTGLIFVVRGDIKVSWEFQNARNVTNIDGIFITNGSFNSHTDSNGVVTSCNTTEQSEQLVINGAVHAFGELCFTRDLGSDNEDTPAEIINFEPKYLYLFQEIVGDPTVIYREVAP